MDALRGRLGLTFPMISDVKLAIAEAYGVRQSDGGIALPSTFIAAPDRKIVFVHVAKNPVDRLATSELLKALKR